MAAPHVQPGFPCPKCGARTDVRDSRVRPDAVVRRRRRCPACAHRLTTYEAPQGALSGLLAEIPTADASLSRQINQAVPALMAMRGPDRTALFSLARSLAGLATEADAVGADDGAVAAYEAAMKESGR